MFAMLRRLPALALLVLLSSLVPARAEDPAEYRLKAAFLFNFALFTEWPAEVGGVLNLCIYGSDPFGKEIDTLQGKAVGGRTIELQRKPSDESLTSCQIVFIAAPAIGSLPRLLERVRGHSVLVVADSVGAARRGAALNLAVDQNKVSFNANLQAARSAGLTLNAKLLRLAAEVIQ